MPRLQWGAMARIYSRKKGRSGSHRPLQRIAPWVKYKPAEIEDIVVKLAKQGLGPAAIGLALRDGYGIPTVRINQARVTRILKAKGLAPAIPEDLYQLLERAVSLDTHLQRNKGDYTSYRGFEIAESKIRRLSKYYRREGKLPADWRYDIRAARLLVKS